MGDYEHPWSAWQWIGAVTACLLGSVLVYVYFGLIIYAVMLVLWILRAS